MISTIVLGFRLWLFQSPTISLELRGVRMENAAPILAKAFGMESLEIGPTLKNEVVIVRTKDVDPEALKAKLAQTLNGTWIHRKEGWWLTQTEDQKADEKKLYDKSRHKFFTQMIEKAKKKLADAKPLDETECKRLLRELQTIASSPVNRNYTNFYARTNKLDDQGPLNRLAYRIAQRITPDVWMKLSDEKPRIVFCSRPTNMQQPFPVPIDDLLALALQEQNAWATFASGVPLLGPSASDQYESHYSLGRLNDHRESFKSTDFSTLTMTLDLQDQGIVINAYNAKGKITLATGINPYEYPEVSVDRNPQTSISELQKRMVTVSGDAAEYLDLFSSANLLEPRQITHKPISPTLLSKMLHPETTDPLSIAAPDVFLARIDSPNVVMVLSDGHKSRRVPEFKDPDYSQSSSTKVSEADGWFLFSQTNPVANRKLMPDRKQLGKLLRFIYENNRSLSIEEQAQLAIDLPWERDISYLFREYMRPFLRRQNENYSSRDPLRILGSMHDGERERARKGGIALSALSDATKLEVYRAIFYSRTYATQAQVDYPTQQPASQNELRQLGQLQQLLYGGLYQEKTFLLPNGLTNNMTITIDDSSFDQLYCDRPASAVNQSYYGDGRSMSAGELGAYLFHLTNVQKYLYEFQGYNLIDENQIHLASQRGMILKVHLNNMMSMQWMVAQTMLTDPTTFTPKTLPQKVRDEVKKGYDQAQENDKYFNGYSSGSYRINLPP